MKSRVYYQRVRLIFYSLFVYAPLNYDPKVVLWGRRIKWMYLCFASLWTLLTSLPDIVHDTFYTGEPIGYALPAVIASAVVLLLGLLMSSVFVQAIVVYLLQKAQDRSK